MNPLQTISGWLGGSTASRINKSDLKRIEQLIEKLMTREEALKAISDINDTIKGIGDEVTKVGGETDTLVKNVADLTTALNNAGGIPQEVADALAAVQTSASNVKTGIQAVDDKVPDAAPPVA